MTQIDKKSFQPALSREGVPRKFSGWVGLILIIVFVVILLPILPLVVGFAKTGQNTTVLNRDYSLLNKKDIITRLKTDFPTVPDFNLTVDKRQFIIKPSSVSAEINYSLTASNLLYRRLNQGVINYFTAFFRPKDFPLEIIYNSDQLDRQIGDIASQIDKPFIPSQLLLNTTGVINVKTGEIGLQVDQPQLKTLVVAALSAYSSDPISIPTKSVGLLPDPKIVQNTLTQANKLIGKSLIFTGTDNPIIIDDKTLISWLDFDSFCRSNSINDYVNSISPSIKKDPVDALFKFENNQVLEFKSSQPGYTLDQNQLISSLCSDIQQLSTSSEKSLSFALPLIYQQPKVSTQEANNLGIKELIGHGESTFSHSTAIRNFNVAKGASIINRLLVAPGATFSFVKALGEVTLDNGYKQAYIIRAGKTELDVGGGICQVSTTFFRALLNAGLNITERQNHAYRVSYYEEDMPPGYDATVFIPSPDLKFINDTGNYILIQSTYDGVKKKLSYDLYGTSDGRKVEISNYRRWDATPAPPDVNIDDPTLPPGKTVQDEHAIPGLKTAFDWKVTRNGEVIRQKTFQSIFVPWAAVYRHGPQI
ncbi:MAG: VanW family protein [Candidatus Shapirobacteria bacterium]|nr:VanW family protein [Candidatus Shapirobacteria bacterium]